MEQYSPEVLKWRIFDELLQNPEKYPDAEKYTRDPSRCYQLSVHLASTFDRYIWYHPDMLLQWRKYPEKKGHWEKTLYLALSARTGNSPESFFADIFSENFKPARPFSHQRYSLFGIGAIPPLLLAFCKKAGEYADIHLFYLNPCREYWGSMQSDMERRRDARKHNTLEVELQINNPLLANLGTWGREFFENTVYFIYYCVFGLKKTVFQLFNETHPKSSFCFPSISSTLSSIAWEIPRCGIVTP